MENGTSSSGIFPRFYVIGNSPKDSKNLQDRIFEPENFEDRIIFMTMFNGIEWTKKGHSEQCVSNSENQAQREEILARTLDIPRPWKRE